jgi:excisionase family DNA binding protein
MVTTAAETTDLLNVRTVARRLNISEWLVRSLIRKGQLPAVRLGNRLMVPVSVVDAVVAQAATKADPSRFDAIPYQP